MSEKQANPAPLGLLGFGMTTTLLNFLLIIQTVKGTGVGQIDAMIIGMGIFYGGLAQIIAGILEYKRGNTFATTAFTSYGLFWLSFIALNWLGTNSVANNYVWPFLGGPYSSGTPWLVSHESAAAYLFMWGIFTFVMFFGTLKTNRTLQFVFMSLAILFFLLAAKAVIQAYNAMTTENLAMFTGITATEGVICGASAVYLALAEVLNEIHGKTVLPT